MGFSYRRRLGQTIRFGWKDAGSIVGKEGLNCSRVSVYLDILSCFRKYYVYSRQYVSNALYSMSEAERRPLAEKIGASNKAADDWADDYYENRKFLRKYSDFKYETSLKLIWKRRDAYRKRYNMGENCAIQNNVILSREHFLPGTISIGNNVLLAKNVFIDYSGEVVIKDGVKIANDVVIESHTHFLNKTDGSAIPGHLIIDDHVKIYTRAYIADSCHHIGRHARIGAGCYVRNTIPPYAIAIGNPAKIIGFVYTPKEIVEFEKENYTESERIPVEVLESNYNKYFKNRVKEIKEFVKQ